MSECIFDISGACIHCGLSVRGKPGRRPCRAKASRRSIRLGDAVAKVLSLFGITKQRVEVFTGKPCGCQKRQEALNTFGSRVARFFSRR